MAGDWFHMRLDLARDPAVASMAEHLGLPVLHVVGCLYAVWAWADEQLQHAGGDVDASVDARVSPSWIDRLAERRGFADAMVRVGWLTLAPEGTVSIPRFGRWMGESAKKRLNHSRRQARWRLGSIAERVDAPVDDAASTATTTRGEESRVDTTTTLGPAVPVAENGHEKPHKPPKKERPAPDPQAAEIASGMATLIQAWDHERSPARLKKVESPASIEEIRRLIAVDGRKPEDVKDLLVWLFRNEPGDYQGTASFDWRTVIQGGQSLRKSWDQLIHLFRFAVTEDPA